MVAAVLAAFACSSSTDLTPNVTPDGFRISLASTPDTVHPGTILTVRMIAENTTSDTIRRAFPVNDFGPQITFDADYLDGSFENDPGFFGSFMQFGSADTLTIPPRQSASGSWTLIARKAGSTTVTGCFPDGNDALRPQVCASRRVTIIAR